MRLTPLPLHGLALVEPQVFADDRGWFTESFNQRDFEVALVAAGLPPAGQIVQDNHSLSTRGVVRGLHFQLPPHAQGKLVRVLRGRIYDAAVDIRQRSPTFGQWFGVELSDVSQEQLWVPPGFAHGFQTLSDEAQVLYKTTAYYAPAAERSLLWNDPAIGIAWPGAQAAILSAKDQAAPLLAGLRPDLFP